MKINSPIWGGDVQFVRDMSALKSDEGSWQKRLTTITASASNCRYWGDVKISAGSVTAELNTSAAVGIGAWDGLSLRHSAATNARLTTGLGLGGITSPTASAAATIRRPFIAMLTISNFL